MGEKFLLLREELYLQDVENICKPHSQDKFDLFYT
jgi:hypothetical protein